jgi:hypothetical protein
MSRFGCIGTVALWPAQINEGSVSHIGSRPLQTVKNADTLQLHARPKLETSMAASPAHLTQVQRASPAAYGPGQQQASRQSIPGSVP